MTAIEFENISKQYRLGLVSTHTLAHDIRRFWLTNVLGKEDPYLKIGETNDRSTKGSSEYVWALRDINFKVEQGDVVGIIGKNGAGKSTLLKLLSRVTGPTTGAIRARGRIGSLLEVGTGFHPEMTGRENIFLNGAILGMTRQEIQKKLDEIVDFSGCERYIDTPVKRYSSGMMVRLGFAVAAHLDPEILVVDEVLAVGDAEFQKKAIGKMQDVSKGEGRTVLFVSHNMASVRTLCSRGIILDKGSIVFDGEIDKAIDLYLYDDTKIGGSKIIDFVSNAKPYIKLTKVLINDTDGIESVINTNQEFFNVHIEGVLEKSMKMDMILTLKTSRELPLASFSKAVYEGEATRFDKGNFIIDYNVEIPTYVAKGDAVIELRLYEPRIQDILVLKNCATMHFEGNMKEYCRPLDLSKEGFIGLVQKK